MRSTLLVANFTCFISIAVATASPVMAEFNCLPAGSSPPTLAGDAFFVSEAAVWSKTTRSRYTEGNGSCSGVIVPGYEGFPTKRCSYKSADAGFGLFPALKGEVVVLNPSAQQLAAWSISACRTNGARDETMLKCLNALRVHIIKSNGAQFPVVGSVIESYCNSSLKYYPCSNVGASRAWLRPRHTWFRDGVAVDYKSSLEIKWDDTKHSKNKFDIVLEVAKSDPYLNEAFAIARVAAAEREQWIAWRRHVVRPVTISGGHMTVEGHGWRTVSASVHKMACQNNSNELFDAVVFSNPSWTRP